MTCDYYDPDEAEQRFDHDMEQLNHIAELEEAVEQLEARISALAAENAVLKQGRREPRKGPRCPLRVAGFDQPDTCDERCAWLVSVNGYLVCAETARAMDSGVYDVGAANWMEVD